MVLFLVALGAATAFADEEGPQSAPLPTSQEVGEAIEGEGSPEIEPALTDPAAAEGVAKQELGREEALELLQGVFEPELQGPAGIFDELQVEKFLAPNVAVIPAAEQPESAEGDLGEGAGDNVPGGATLMDSTVPLGTKGPSGALEPVDLSLEEVEGQLKPANALVDVGIPSELGEGIELPESQISITLESAPAERAPSTIGDTVGFYPNVAQDTDLAVAPTANGVETLTQLRTPDSPLSETFKLDLPAGSSLEAAEGGGAVAVDGDQEVLAIPPPSAIDATGEKVPVTLAVSGDSLTLTVSPGGSPAYPILVDPLFQSYWWPGSNISQNGICNDSFEFHSQNSCGHREEWGLEQNYGRYPPPIGWNTKYLENNYLVPYGTPGLVLSSSGAVTAGEYDSWIYTVPRYFTDATPPTSFISHLTFSDLIWKVNGSYASPYLFAGIWDSTKPVWVAEYHHESSHEASLLDTTWQYSFANENPQTHLPDTNAKVGEVSIQATASEPSSSAYLYVGAATVELADTDAPQQPVIPTAPPPWVNQTAPPIAFTATDTGLGVYALSANTEQLGTNGQPLHSWKAAYGCIGVADAACPRTWISTWTGHPELKYEPSLLPTGISYLNVVAEDPVGNKSVPASVQVKVDHTAPELTLSGALNEQLKLGTTLPKYGLTLSASDGEVGHPQSGAAKTTIKVDGKVVDEYSPGCSTENCAFAREWSLEASQFEPGAHTIEAIATDAVGNSRTKTLKIELHPTPPPALTLSGSMTEQATLGTQRPRYTLTTAASASPQSEVGGIYAPGVPMLLGSFGASGTGNGQFTNPGGVAVDAQRDALVTDTSAGRIEKFNAAGEYLSQIGSKGTGNGQLTEPAGVAVDAKGNIWVANAGNNRIEEFNEAGQYVARFGSKGTANGQFEHPEGIAIDPKGNVWVADTRNGRLQEFNEKGEFIKVLGTKGTASGQLYEPAGLSVGANGNIWVADWHNNAVLEFSEAGTFVRQFGIEGTGNAQFVHPGAVSVDNQGKVWAVDAGNSRVEVFNEKGVYINQFGSKGTGKGQLSLTRPVGIATDRQGDVWVTDNANKRVEKWHTVGPNYVSAFGTKGSANGQLINPAGIARDSSGNLWVVDTGNSRVEKFSEAGTYLSKFGFKGSEKPEFFLEPTAIAIDSVGNLWIADSGNNRLQEFSSAGKYLKTLGTKGIGNGQFERPEGLAFDSKGNLWVSDSHGARLEEFNEKGEFLRTAGAKGTTGALGEPVGIAIDSENNVWVADSSKNRIAKFNEKGEYLSQFGTEGSGGLQFVHPSDVYVDPAVDGAANADVWVLDTGNDRIDKTWLQALSLGQFGGEGSSPGQFNLGHAAALAVGPEGNLWITDAGNNRVQRLHETTTRSTVGTEVTVDGKKVDSGEVACANESCSVNHEWTLESSAYSVGKHTVVVTATDGVGRTTTKTLTIEVQRDAAKPTLEASGSLFEAPMGWVEQQNYSVTGKAADSGSGVTQLKLMIDGTQAGIATQTCVNGGCSLTNTFTIDTSKYPGGAHEAELIATDGAGNATTKKWTINVDPEGKVTVAEVIDTVEAAESTGSTEVIQGGAEEEPLTLQESGGALDVVGGSMPTSIAKNPEKGVNLEILEGGAVDGFCEGGNLQTEPPEPCENNGGPAEEGPDLNPIVIEPTGTNAAASEVIPGPEGASGVAANTSGQADTVIRPIYDGDLAFQMIRDTSAPESYSWIVHLEGGATLKLLSPQYAQVYYAGGHTAFGISAEPAHDAVGTAVPTELTVSEGDILTLTVKHHAASFVYPILAGTGWEGGFFTNVVIGPKDERELREEREQLEREEREAREREEEGQGLAGAVAGFWSHQLPNGSWVAAEGGEAIVGPPEFEPQASASGVVVGPSRASRSFSAAACWHFPFSGISPPAHPNPHAGHCQVTANLATRGWVHGRFHWETAPNKHVWWDGGREGEIQCTTDFLHNAEWRMWPKECHFAGENQQPGHIVARNFWRVETYNGVQNAFGYEVVCIPMYFDLFSNGNVDVEDNFYGQGAAIRFVGHSDSCPWPQ